MIKELIKLANHLDSKGLAKEADALDGVVKRMLKKSAGRRVVETIGSVKIYKDSDWGEYIVVPEGGSVDDDGYHTDDLEDAVDTARHMDSENGGSEDD